MSWPSHSKGLFCSPYASTTLSPCTSTSTSNGSAQRFRPWDSAEDFPLGTLFSKPPLTPTLLPQRLPTFLAQDTWVQPASNWQGFYTEERCLHLQDDLGKLEDSLAVGSSSNFSTASNKLKARAKRKEASPTPVPAPLASPSTSRPTRIRQQALLPCETAQPHLSRTRKRSASLSSTPPTAEEITQMQKAEESRQNRERWRFLREHEKLREKKQIEVEDPDTGDANILLWDEYTELGLPVAEEEERTPDGPFMMAKKKKRQRSDTVEEKERKRGTVPWAAVSLEEGAAIVTSGVGSARWAVSDPRVGQEEDEEETEEGAEGLDDQLAQIDRQTGGRMEEPGGVLFLPDSEDERFG